MDSDPALLAMLKSSFERAPWGWGLFLTVTGVVVKGWPAIVDAVTRAKTSLGDRRLSRIERLEARIDQQRAIFDAETAVLRHDLANMTACLDALLLLIETAPEKAAEHARKVREMREQSSDKVRQEKQAYRAAQLAPTLPDLPSDG